jgi:hypothetical protein
VVSQVSVVPVSVVLQSSAEVHRQVPLVQTAVPPQSEETAHDG